jgi:hypothetical protein
MLLKLLVFFGVLNLSSFEGSSFAQAPESVKNLHNWTHYGRRLFGEAFEVQNASQTALRNFPQIEKELTLAIESNQNRELAADVIAALKLYNLMDVLVKNSKTDDYGHLYLAMNSLITNKNRQALIDLYVTRLESEETRLGAKIVILDTLGRLKHKLTEAQLNKVVGTKEYELQTAFINYLRRNKQQYNTKQLKPVVNKLMNSPYYQTRLFTLHSLPFYFVELKKCQTDSHPLVKAKCKDLAQNKDINW